VCMCCFYVSVYFFKFFLTLMSFCDKISMHRPHYIPYIRCVLRQTDKFLGAWPSLCDLTMLLEECSRINTFLPRDAIRRERLCHSMSSVCPSVRDVQVPLNSSQIISRPNSLRLMRGLTPTWAIWCNGNTPKIRAELGWGHSGAQKTCKYLRNGAR